MKSSRFISSNHLMVMWKFMGLLFQSLTLNKAFWFRARTYLKSVISCFIKSTNSMSRTHCHAFIIVTLTWVIELNRLPNVTILPTTMDITNIVIILAFLKLQNPILILVLNVLIQHHNNPQKPQHQTHWCVCLCSFC